MSEQMKSYPEFIDECMKRAREGKLYTIEAKKNVGEIYLYDVVGDSWDGTTAVAFKNDLQSIGSVNELRVYINSPGGSVFDGIGIFNVLRRHSARKIVKIDGIAASIASVVAMAGDEIEIAANGMIMIHNPWAVTMGDENAHEKAKQTLSQIRQVITNTYSTRTGGKADAIAEMMSDETWMDAGKAVEFGFADRVVEEASLAALSGLKLDVVNGVPKSLIESPKSQSVSEPFEPTPHPALAKMDNRLRRRGIKQGRPCGPSTPAA